MALTPHPRVTIDGSSLGSPNDSIYESEVNGTFSTIRLNQVGQALVNEFIKNMRITPYTGTDLNATASPSDWDAAGVAGRAEYQCDNGMPILDGAGSPVRSTGGGSNSDVEFTPSMWMTDGVAEKQKKQIASGKRRDEILFHEMVHSIRQMAGVMNCSIGHDGYDTKEEVWGIITANIYSSAWNRPLRKDHAGFITLTAAEATKYFQTFEVMIGHMCRELPRFTRTVANIAWIPFNPYRTYYEKNP